MLKHAIDLKLGCTSRHVTSYAHEQFIEQKVPSTHSISGQLQMWKENLETVREKKGQANLSKILWTCHNACRLWALLAFWFHALYAETCPTSQRVLLHS